MVDTTILHSYGYLDSSIGTLLKVEHLIAHSLPYYLKLKRFPMSANPSIAFFSHVNFHVSFLFQVS